MVISVKKLIKVLSVVFVCMLVLTNVFALSIDDVDKPFNSNGVAIGQVEDAIGSVWATIVVIVQILAIAAVVFAGLRYMFASADTKADIKRSMGILAVGALLVFASTTIVSFIVKAGQEALK